MTRTPADPGNECLTTLTALPRSVRLTLLWEDSSFVSPREEIRAGAERQAHPGADEVVHDCLDRGAIERTSPEAPD